MARGSIGTKASRKVLYTPMPVGDGRPYSDDVRKRLRSNQETSKNAASAASEYDGAIKDVTDFEADKQSDGVQTQADKQSDGVQTQADKQSDGVQTQADKQSDRVQTQADKQSDRVQTQADKQSDRVQTQADKQSDGVQTQADKQSDRVQTQADKQSDGVQTQADKQSDGVQTQADRVGQTLPAKTPRNRLPTGENVRRVMCFLGQRDHASTDETTGTFTLRELSDALSIPRTGIDVALRRIRNASLAVRARVQHGNGGWVEYRLLKRGRQYLADYPPQTQAPSETQTPSLNTPPLHVVCSRLSSTTPNSKAVLAKFAQLCIRYELAEHGIDANSLMQVWRTEAFENLEDLLASAAHVAWYLSSPQANGIKHPKAWFVQTLSKGIYAPPAGFESWEERQERIKLEESQRKLARLRELQQKRFETDFQIWLAETDDDDLRQRLTPFLRENPRSAAAMSCLREAYGRETGVPLHLLTGASHEND
jgi:hypothetical protein